MFGYSIKYLNICIKNHRIKLAKTVPKEDIKIKKQLGKAKYNKKQMRKLEDKEGYNLNDVTDKW